MTTIQIGNPVLFHTLPPNQPNDEAIFRQYNSCVEFTFRANMSSTNARKLRRLNAIFEKAADRNVRGIREDKLLKILPEGTALKFGIDPNKLLHKVKTIKSSCYDPDTNTNENVHPNVPGTDESTSYRFISRGTFLAMFALESSTFINTTAQNELALRTITPNKAEVLKRPQSRIRFSKNENHPLVNSTSASKDRKTQSRSGRGSREKNMKYKDKQKPKRNKKTNTDPQRSRRKIKKPFKLPKDDDTESDEQDNELAYGEQLRPLPLSEQSANPAFYSTPEQNRNKVRRRRQEAKRKERNKKKKY